MTWVAAAVVAGSAVSAYSANKAAGAQKKAAGKAASAEQAMFERNVELQEPFRQGGLAAQNRLLHLLGLESPGLAEQEWRTQQEAAGPLFDVVGGVPQVNTQRYASDPVYKEAWDKMLGMHQRQFGHGYTQRSKQDVLQHQIQGLIDADPRTQQAREKAFATGGTDKGSDFGKYARDFGMSDFQEDPGYAFRMKEGLKALDRQAASRGGLISGAALKAAQNYGQEAASQEYQNAFNRYQVNRSNQLSPLQSLMGAGQTSATTIGQLGANAASNIGNAYMNAGDARAAGYMGVGNAINQGIGTYVNYQNANTLANALKKP